MLRLLMPVGTALLRKPEGKRFSAAAVQTVNKPKVVIIGCGWGGFRCANDIDKSKYDVKLVSMLLYAIST